MFHLFDRTYLVLDTHIDLDFHRFVISKEFGLPLEPVLETLHPNKLMGYGKSFDDLVGEDKQYKTYAELLQRCIQVNNTKQKVVIYCDKESFFRFASLWFKSLFKQIDCASAFKIIRAYFLKFILLSDISYRGVKGIAEYYNDKQPNYEEFESVFNSLVEDKTITYTISTVKDKRSVEFLLASYLYDGSCREELKKPVRVMISRHVEEYLKEAWRNIMHNSLRIPMQNAFNLNYNLNNLEEIYNEPRIQILTDLNAWRTVHSKFNSRPDLDLTLLSDSDIVELKNLLRISYISNLPGLEEYLWTRVYLYIDILRSPVLTDEGLQSIIDLEISLASGESINPLDRFWGYKDVENLNTFLADHFIREKILGNVEELGRYVLR